jgi:hypothetical protein
MSRLDCLTCPQLTNRTGSGVSKRAEPVTSVADVQMDEVRLLEPIEPMPTITDCERDLVEIAS